MLLLSLLQFFSFKLKKKNLFFVVVAVGLRMYFVLFIYLFYLFLWLGQFNVSIRDKLEFSVKVQLVNTDAAHGSMRAERRKSGKRSRVLASTCWGCVCVCVCVCV